MTDTGNIIHFNPISTVDTAPALHLAGKARCLDCGTEWAAVVPIGTCYLECPKCATVRGVMRSPVGADNGASEWTCRCGCDVFKIVQGADGKSQGILCLRCGEPQAF